MTLQKLMLVYQENRRDLFIIHSEDMEELHRFNMDSYFTEDFDTAYGYSRVISFIVDVVDQYCLHFQIYLDVMNPKKEEEW